MNRILTCLTLGLALVGCAAPAQPPVTEPLAPQAPARYALQELGASLTASVEVDPTLFSDAKHCGEVRGTGDSHPGDGRFYELTVNGRRSGNVATGTVLLYTMKDVLGAPTIAIDPRVYRGTITKLALKGDRAWARGVLDTGAAFSLEVLDQGDNLITEAPPYDWFWFDTAGLHVESAYIHEGNFEVEPKSCEPIGL